MPLPAPLQLQESVIPALPTCGRRRAVAPRRFDDSAPSPRCHARIRPPAPASARARARERAQPVIRRLSPSRGPYSPPEPAAVLPLQRRRRHMQRLGSPQRAPQKEHGQDAHHGHRDVEWGAVRPSPRREYVRRPTRRMDPPRRAPRRVHDSRLTSSPWEMFGRPQDRDFFLQSFSHVIGTFLSGTEGQ